MGSDMTEVPPDISQKYLAALQQYLARQEEAALQQAYELAREVMARGKGVMEMARLHQEAMRAVPAASLSPATHPWAMAATETFFLESLSPFEATQRGFHEANVRLRQLIGELESRNTELSKINGELQTEIAERLRAEAALRESEEHYRQLFTEAQAMQESLRELSTRILHVQEQERTRISRELHDEVGQALTAINVNLAMLVRKAVSDPVLFQNKTLETQGLVEQTMATVHRFAHELRPAMLDDLGLLPALRTYVNSFAERNSIQVRFRSSAEAERLDGERKTVIYRVAQESLTNIAKHAQATKVEVSIRKLKGCVCVKVEDNGRAFDINAANGKKRLGLLGMQERVRLVSGRFAVESAPGKGTIVRVEIPFQPVDIARPTNHTASAA